MEKIGKTDDLFARAIAAEKAARDFYKGLSQLFSHVPEARLIWDKMMRDEDYHASELQKIRNSLTDEQLNKPADRSLCDKLTEEAESFSAEFALEKVRTLDDAIDLAYELEYSEVNTVFQAIIREFVSSETRTNFVLSLVKEHVSRLEEFSRIIPSPEGRSRLCAVHTSNG